MLVLGLAPAAHGANRTGRMFTGDRSGDFLFAALWRAGFANQPGSTGRGDGLTLTDMWITAAVRCAPPANRPTPAERDACLPFGARELALLSQRARAAVPGRVRLGCRPAAPEARRRRRAATVTAPALRPRSRAGGGRYRLLGCYHPSQQNTFTGRLTESMMDSVLMRARELAGGPL
jgi:uracil-DNA glycosylase